MTDKADNRERLVIGIIVAIIAIVVAVRELRTYRQRDAAKREYFERVNAPTTPR